MEIKKLIIERDEIPLAYRKHIENINFMEIYQLFLEYAYYRFKKKNIDKYIELENYLDDVLVYCQKVLETTLVYEINLLSESGKLEGIDEYERYKYFIYITRELEKDKSILYSYPVAVDLILNYIDKKVNNYKIILFNYFKDKKKIEEVFKTKTLLDIEMKGDTHKGGQSVAKLIFENTSIIYKPRNLVQDIAFQDLLAWFNKHTDLLNLKTMTILNYEDYGWMEYIDCKPCENKIQIEKYFERQGYYLALFYLLNGTDMHNENIISFSEYPIYIDLETIFHNQSHSIGENRYATKIAEEMVSSSIFSSNILPISITNKRFENFNFSALNYIQGSVKTYEMINEFTDKIRMRKVKKEIASFNQHLPSYKNEFIDGKNYIFNIISGYKKMMQAILKEKTNLLKIYGPFHSFKGKDVRQVLRPTYFYGRLIDGAHHPNYLKSNEDRLYFFRKLYKLDNYNLPKSLIDKEIEQLLEDDIPMFYSNNASNKIYINNTSLDNFYTTTSFDKMQQKIEQLNNESIENQIKMIIGSLDAYSDINFTHNKNRLLLESCIIGESVLKKKISNNDNTSITWNTFNINHFGNLNYETMDVSLYSGLSGMLLFYGHLYKNSGIQKYLEVSYQIFETILHEIKEKKTLDVSLFNGISGVLFSISHLDFISKNEMFKSKIDNILNEIERLIPNDQQYDLIGGVSGIIIALISYYNSTGNEKVLSIAWKAYEHLMKNALQDNKGHFYWKPITYGVSQINTYGLAHGNSGIALGVFKLYKVTKSEKLKKVISNILETETTLINEKFCLYKDLTNSELTWCKGLISVYYIYYLMINEKFKISIPNVFKEFIKSLEKCNVTMDVCLCHGFIGTYEIMRLINKNISPVNLSKIESYINKKVNFHENWWSNQMGKFNNCHGLMIGDVGVGYQLLRTYSDQVPDTLLFSNI